MMPLFQDTSYLEGSVNVCVLTFRLSCLSRLLKKVWTQAAGDSYGNIPGTLIPSYETYDNTWRRALWVNPFEVNWSAYDRYDAFLSGYIDTLLSTMEEHVGMWGVDENSAGTEVFRCYNEFLSTLKRYYEYYCKENV